jgi:hypothetical protein
MSYTHVSGAVRASTWLHVSALVSVSTAFGLYEHASNFGIPEAKQLRWTRPIGTPKADGSLTVRDDLTRY